MEYRAGQAVVFTRLARQPQPPASARLRLITNSRSPGLTCNIMQPPVYFRQSDLEDPRKFCPILGLKVREREPSKPTMEPSLHFEGGQVRRILQKA